MNSTDAAGAAGKMTTSEEKDVMDILEAYMLSEETIAAVDECYQSFDVMEPIHSPKSPVDSQERMYGFFLSLL